MLAQQVVDELLAGVAGDLVGRVHEAQGRGRDDRLLHRHVGVPQGHVQVAVRVPLVAERAGRQPRHPADVAGRERDLEAVRGGVRQPVHAVRPEVVVLPLLAVGDDRRAGGLEPLDGVADRLVVERVQRRVGAVSRRDRLDEPRGLGMLPIGSVGIVMGVTRFGDSWPSHSIPRFLARSMRSNLPAIKRVGIVPTLVSDASHAFPTIQLVAARALSASRKDAFI